MSNQGREAYIRKELNRMSETISDMARMDFGNTRHRRIAPKNLQLLAGQIVELSAHIAFEISATPVSTPG